MGASKTFRAVLVAVLLVAPLGAEAGGTPAPVPAAPLSVEADLNDGIYAVKGRFEVPVSKETAQEVLTDYEGMTRFVPSMRKSTVRVRRPDFLYVEQEAVETAVFIPRSMRVLLVVREDGDRITFRDISQRDFLLYEGAWTVEALPGGCRVTYSLRANPKGPAPGFIAVPTFKSAGARMLNQLRAEMVRRAGAKNP